MPSSTSSSRWTVHDRALAALGASLVLVFLGLEVAMRLVLPAISNTERRVLAARAAAKAVRPTDERGRPTALIVGNSLLIDGIDPVGLQAQLDGTTGITLFPVEGTTYLDWYFGLRRLQDDGAAPATMVLCLNARQVISDATQGEAFAHEMMRGRDLPDVVRSADLNLTAASAFLFANHSAWLGKRQGFRNGLTQMWLPNAAELVATFSDTGPAAPTVSSEDIQKAVDRLVAFEVQARARGGRFWWLVPPSTNVLDPAPRIAAAARQRGINVAIPFIPGEMPAEHFKDGFHLAPEGAALFTQRTATILKESL